MTEQAKVPEIRFAGFTDPWEQRKLGELFEESDERASDREILSVSVANGIYPASESDRETNPGASLANYKIVHFGDVVYNSMRMWQGAVDASRYDGIVSPAYVVARPNSEVYARFFARLLRQPMLLKQYQQVSQGNSKDTQVLKFDDFASIGISMPASENEQRRIGGFFDRLDSLITLHQRKYDKLVVFKKSMLEKMFPKDGESVPEIRFAGFTDPWEQRKASEVFQIVDDRGHPTLPVLSATQNQGMIYRDDSGRYIGHDESNEIGYKRVLPGDFVVHLRSFQGGFAHSQYEGITSPAYTVFRAKEPTSHSDRFWKHWFMSEHFIAGLSTVTYGIRDGRSISVDEFMNTFLAFPAVEEQAAISRLFDYLDDLITLHQRKLELLQNIKKSLLDKMFA
ncbi:restriction endonuclease S subunit [Bifidobacterium longum subsp. longum]|uniref:restriction endonuclease subunit S n=1 Tax=Bifidobacterium longum TaxID=216816 RepID=UPI0010D72506|nr:restriction endonuclease S subunit [Bifidobacterium longum subsp. longum]